MFGQRMARITVTRSAHIAQQKFCRWRMQHGGRGRDQWTERKPLWRRTGLKVAQEGEDLAE